MLSVSDFYLAGRNGKLLGLACEQGHVTVPPRASCRVCKSQSLRTVELSGRGEVVSFTEVHSKSSEFPLEAPYVLALVKLEEGGNLLGVIETQQANVKDGASVSVEFREAPNSPKQEWPRIFFRLG
ncbi:MAG: Zn-ribbon domain-containing OB-fold protein [Nitrososphaerota archaeon]|nr:Zn-ribbon domain-containing OB-fold protein [Nitrososphaerota archaeon]